MGEQRRHHNLLTTAEAAADLNCEVKKVWRLIHDHQLQAMDITPNGKRATYRIAPEHLAEFKRKALVIPDRVAQRRRRQAAPSTPLIRFSRCFSR